MRRGQAGLILLFATAIPGPISNLPVPSLWEGGGEGAVACVTSVGCRRGENSPLWGGGGRWGVAAMNLLWFDTRQGGRFHPLPPSSPPWLGFPANLSVPGDNQPSRIWVAANWPSLTLRNTRQVTFSPELEYNRIDALTP